MASLENVIKEGPEEVWFEESVSGRSKVHCFKRQDGVAIVHPNVVFHSEVREWESQSSRRSFGVLLEGAIFSGSDLEKVKAAALAELGYLLTVTVPERQLPHY
jgi:hypothetical protein